MNYLKRYDNKASGTSVCYYGTPSFYASVCLVNLAIKAWSSVYHKVSADLVRVVEAGAQHPFSCFTELHDQRDPEGTRPRKKEGIG